jgi:hypothetical protein
LIYDSGRFAGGIGFRVGGSFVAGGIVDAEVEVHCHCKCSIVNVDSEC